MYLFVLAVLLALPLDGCGTGTSSTAPAPHLLGTSPTVSSPVCTVPQRGGRTVGELQLARDPSLRVDPLRDTVVVLLEPETASSSGDDTATLGVDAIPFGLAATSPVAVSVDSESVGYVVIGDAQGRVRFREPSGSARVVTLEAGDHTLELHSTGERSPQSSCDAGQG